MRIALQARFYLYSTPKEKGIEIKALIVDKKAASCNSRALINRSGYD
jgi:hypothetical protein